MPLKMIFGIGTGRCGTVSLRELLAKQSGVSATHEKQFCPWEPDLVAFYQALLKEVFIAARPIHATVAFYWIKYLGDIFRDVRDPKVICLKRRREEVVKSFAGMYQDRNHWSDPKGDKFTGRNPGLTVLNAMWPKYNLPKEEAIGAYWDEYYAIAEKWAKMYPENMIIVDTHLMFSDKEYQKAALEFVGIEDPVIDLNIKKNATAERVEPLVVKDVYVSQKTLNEAANNRLLFGQAAYARNLPVGVEVVLSDEDWARLEAMPNFDKLPRVGEESGSIHNRESGSR